MGLGIGAVLALGHYAGYELNLDSGAAAGDAKEPAGQSAEAPPTQGTEQSGGGTPPAADPAPAPGPEEEPEAVTPDPEVDPAEAIREARTRIDRTGGASNKFPVVIYYADGLRNAEVLQPVEVCIPHTESRIRVTAEQVFNAPTDLKLFSSVPPGAQVKSVSFDRATGVAKVDASRELLELRGSAAVNNVTASLVYSLTAIPEVKSVLLTIEGESALLDQKEWSTPLTKQDLDQRNLFRVEPVIFYEPKC